MLWSVRKLLTAATAMVGLSSVLMVSQVNAMDSFEKASMVLPSIYSQLDREIGNTTTLYCGCALFYRQSGDSTEWFTDTFGCGYEPRRSEKRANSVAFDRVMSPWVFAQGLECWFNGGRRGCIIDEKFNLMDGDMHNIFPAIGEISGNRATFRFDDWGERPSQYGSCPVVVDFAGRRAQPSDRSRGQIARAMLYMCQRYRISIGGDQHMLFEQWNEKYPPDVIECRRNELIAEFQGNDNPFITSACTVGRKRR